MFDVTPEKTVDLLTSEEVAKLFRVDKTTVRRWTQNGSLTAVTLPTQGKRTSYRYHRADIEQILFGARKNA
jgi:excisionase family DNA binding protein